MKFTFIRDIKNYKISYLKADIMASFSTALLTIPQSIAYSILASLPPSAGLFAAIFGSIFVGSLGSSKYLIAGPTTAVAILLQTTVANVIYNYYPNISGAAKEALVISILCHVVLIVGVLQIIFGICKMGKILQFVSRSVVLGYFAGVIVAIIVNQLYPFFGIKMDFAYDSVLLKLWNLILGLKNISFSTFSLGIFSAFMLFFMRKKFKNIPYSFFVLVVVSILAYFFNKYFFPLKSEKLHIFSLKDLGFLSLPKLIFRFPILEFKIINVIFPSALAITLIGILEVFSVSKSLSFETGKRVDYNQEVLSIGLSNSFLSLFNNTMPASGSISRTLFNYKSKAKTRFSAVFCGLFVAFFIFLLWPFVQHIPMVALASILIMLVPTFLDYRQIKFCFTVTKGDSFVFLLTMGACLLFSLDIAFFIGIVISIASYLKRAAVPHVVEYAFNPKGRLVIVSKKKRVRRKIRIIGIGGELFFASVDVFQSTLQEVARDSVVKSVVLRLNNVYYMDASMCFAILNLYEYLKKRKKYLIISGITKELWQVFLKAKLVETIGEDNLFISDESKPQLSTWHACVRAQKLST